MRLYRNLRQAATSIHNATTALQRPKPKPRRRFGKIAVLAFALGGTAVLALKLHKQQSTPDQPPTPPTTVDTATAGGGSADPIPAPDASRT
jgi:ferric-dicitrate binding protein FerR (iron transport regulator)